MSRILAGDLSATFNIDGLHLERFTVRRDEVVRSICDYLLLHDQILVPTQDYITAAGLVRVLGERNLMTLLEQDRVRFVRLRGAFTYMRGSGRDGGLIGLVEPSGRLFASAGLERAVDASLGVVRDELNEFGRLKNLLLEHTRELQMSAVVDIIRKDAYADLAQSHLWRPQYRNANPDRLELPRIATMQGRVIGPGMDVSKSVVDACLALGLMNIELFLAKEFDCDTSATGSPMGDSIALKLHRLLPQGGAHNSLWGFMEGVGIPDVARTLIANPSSMPAFIELTTKSTAQEFRTWFHSSTSLNEKELVAAYVDALRQIPWVQSENGRTVRMVASLGLGALSLGPAVDLVSSVIDNFIIENFARKRGPKFFVEDFKKFSDRIHLPSKAAP